METIGSILRPHKTRVEARSKQNHVKSASSNPVKPRAACPRPFDFRPQSASTHISDSLRLLGAPTACFSGFRASGFERGLAS